MNRVNDFMNKRMTYAEVSVTSNAPVSKFFVDFFKILRSSKASTFRAYPSMTVKSVEYITENAMKQMTGNDQEPNIFENNPIILVMKAPPCLGSASEDPPSRLAPRKRKHRAKTRLTQ